MNLTKKMIPARTTKTRARRRCERSAGLPFVLLIVLAAIGSSGASRPAAAATISYFLNESNETSVLPDGTDYLEVTLSNNGTDVFFNVDILPALSQYGDPTGFGLDSFGFNTTGAADNLTTNNIVALPANWSADSGANQDGFGRFDLIPSSDTGSAATRVTDLTFEIAPTGTETSVDQNLADYVVMSSHNGNGGSNTQDFAAHVAGFTIAGSSITSAYFGGSMPAPVPLPAGGGLLLGGLGLLRVLGRRRRTL